MTHEMAAAVGKDIRTAREAAGLTQEALAELFDNGRDWLSKAERGVINISVVDYLELVDYLRQEMPPDHPAVALVTYFKRRRARV